jgi:hypothetical protein
MEVIYHHINPIDICNHISEKFMFAIYSEPTFSPGKNYDKFNNFFLNLQDSQEINIVQITFSFSENTSSP